MRKRPKELLILAVALILIVTAMPLQVALMFGHPPWEAVPIAAKLAPMNWVVMMLAACGAVLAWRGSSLLLGFAPMFIMAVAWNHWIIASYQLNAGRGALLLSTAGVMLLMALLAFPDPLKVLLNPKLRWWRTPVRRAARLRAVVWPVLGGEVRADTVDVSETGAFISWSGAADEKLPVMLRNLRAGSHCTIRIALSRDRAIRCMAQVVRQTRALGAYPEGFAVRFVSLEREERKLLSRFVAERSAPVLARPA